MKVTTASAGTGKTTALTRRVLELICSGTPLRRIAAVTFTRDSASDLRTRIREGIQHALTHSEYMGLTIPEDKLPLLEEAAREVGGAAIDTIHGFMARTVRLVAPALTRDPQLVVLESWEAEQLFALEVNTLTTIAGSDAEHPLHESLNTLTAAGVDVTETTMELFKARQLADEIASAGGPVNDALKTVYDYAYRGPGGKTETPTGFLARLGLSLTTPAELEQLAIAAASGAQSIRERIASRTSVLMVDEYQDVNPMQARFFENLEQAGVQVEVVGDPKQSIYLFRNADVGMFRAARANGVEGETLATTYRHSRVLTRFLNILTASLAENNMGFGPEEAPEVETARTEMGRLEAHYVTSPQRTSLAKLRTTEAQVLADRLHDARKRGWEWKDMAVLARGGTALQILTKGLTAAGVPYVMARGKHYYQRQEILDLGSALKVATKPTTRDWYTFLRSAFANLPASSIKEIVHHEGDTYQFVREHYPRVWEVILDIQRIASGHPGGVLADLAHERLINNQSFMETLSLTARDNVTHLTRVLNKSEPASISHLIDELERLSNQTEASDMPQAANAVTITTIHSSKGLQWPVVGVFDLGAHDSPQSKPIIVDPGEKVFALNGTETYDTIKTARKNLERQETYRLLYVAVSRARDEMILTGSYAKNYGPLLEALNKTPFGPYNQETNRGNFILEHHEHNPKNELTGNNGGTPQATTSPATGLNPAPWTTRTFPEHPMPPVNSPTRHLERQQETKPTNNQNETPNPTNTQPLEVNVADIMSTSEPGNLTLDEDEIPDRSRVVGTLVHYGIHIGWDPGKPEHQRELSNQALLQQFPDEDRDELVADILQMLSNYREMVDSGMVVGPVGDEVREWPLQVRYAGTVWTGIIDRLYKSGDEWILEDYKTDGRVNPENYFFQLGLYAHAVEQHLGVTPTVQLVYVRRKEVLTLDNSDLQAAIEEHTKQAA